ncbi:MAG: hypothetical protein LAO78_12085 [Acidobacteriia bacterium]|nr:hypothetical protein [Terriglobia bacterium]
MRLYEASGRQPCLGCEWGERPQPKTSDRAKIFRVQHRAHYRAFHGAHRLRDGVGGEPCEALTERGAFQGRPNRQQRRPGTWPSGSLCD